MKKIIFGLIGCFMVGGLLAAAAITVNKPNGNESWELGLKKQITWTATAVTQNVRLVLYQNGSRVGRIANNLPAAPGSYEWIVGKLEGGSAPAGEKYEIQVRTIDGSVSDDSDGFFTITHKYAISQPGPGNATLPTLGNLQPVQAIVPQLKVDPRIDRIDPNPTELDYVIGAVARGKGFGANSETNTPYFRRLYAECRRTGSIVELPVDEWRDQSIRFRLNRNMAEDDYRVFIAHLEGREILSNKVDLRVGTMFKLNAIMPGHLLANHNGLLRYVLIGVNFGRPTSDRYVKLRGRTPGTINLISLTITRWDDKVIGAEISQPLPAGDYEVEAYYMDGGRRVGGLLWVEAR
ncbi:MAG: hypothetical protein MUP71_10220 [Candidatus Aminicenantes bacterium]|nr:hypothetical protein [Candidatus Aminicenantes bacterium]